MRKIVFLVSILVFSTNVFSQGVRMGLAASPQISWMNSDASSISTNGTQIGFNFGLITDFFFADRYSLSTGLTINNTGGKLKFNDSLNFETNDKIYELGQESEITYKIQYIDVPLSFRMESNQIGYFVYYAQFGVTNHFRVAASADINGNADGLDVSLSGVGCKNEINIFNMGYNIGAGTNYYFSKNTAITLGVIYTNGFIDVTNNKDKQVTDNVSLRSVTLKIGVLF